MSAIPCKRPKVTVTPRTPDDDRHDADCHVPGCSWTYPLDKQFMALKSDAEYQATTHRREHREAVPDTAVLLRRGGGYRAECDCGWTAVDGCVTRTDNEASLASHLSTAHGVVTCS